MRVVTSPTFLSRPVRVLTGLLPWLLALQIAAMPVAGQTSGDAGAQAPSSSTSAANKAKPGKAKKTSKAKAKGKKAGKAVRARTARIKQAFVASTELRPMAQQLSTMRTPAAYAGVTSYAHKHSGEAAAAAYLALGHAYLLDKRYAEAAASFREARQSGDVLADYADFLSAQANHESGNQSAAEAVLHDFADRYPDSIFDAQAPELEAITLLAMNDPAGAQRVLTAAADSPAASRPGFQLAQGEAAFKLGQGETAGSIFKRLLLGYPLSSEAETARAKLTAMGLESSLTIVELRSLGDAYYNGGHYEDASEQYRALARKADLDAGTRNAFAVAAAACDLKLKRLTTAQAEALADSNDENGARRLYLLMELARNRDDLSEQKRIVTEMETRFPQSNWLAEALYSSGNMYMLRREYASAVEYYSTLATRFPEHKNASAAHWRAGWLSYSIPTPPGSSTSRSGCTPAPRRRPQHSIGGVGSMRRRNINRSRPRPTIAPWSASTSTFFMRRWPGSGWPRSATLLWRSRRHPRLSWIKSRLPRCRHSMRAFPRTACTWPRRVYWPMPE